MPDPRSTIDIYDQHAEYFAARYDAIPFESAHAALLDWLPDKPGLVLDVGAGSGRDARWFAARGHEVFAVEPAKGFRERGRDAAADARIHWIDDRLPELGHIGRGTATWDLIWLSAVWMHIAPGQRPRAFRKLASRLRPGGRMIVTLRHGSFDDGRASFPVTVEELLRLSRDHGLVCRHIAESRDAQERAAIHWTAMVLELPDDGSGAFPILRSIVLNDAKSSTYKLGLLRCLLRIASTAPGLAASDGQGSVRLPLGLVALYWIRSYLPLVGSSIPQMPRGAGSPAFVSPAFQALRVSGYSLKVGARFSGPQAVALSTALRDAAKLIRDMPVRYITWPNTGRQIFGVEYRGTRSQSSLLLDRACLEAFGSFIVPEFLWQAMTRNAIWIEPAVLSEWIALMSRYEPDAQRPWQSYHALLRWIDPAHDTSAVRVLVDDLRAARSDLSCIWTARRLPRDYAVDHLMPFAHWPCNDLWNLAPVSRSANSSKADRLPSVDAMARAEDRLCGWWRDVREHSGEYAVRFDEEVRCALPFVQDPADAAEVFEGLSVLRASLRRDQRIPEWTPQMQ
jgi:SAM-dependent methyltransferase